MCAQTFVLRFAGCQGDIEDVKRVAMVSASCPYRFHNRRQVTESYSTFYRNTISLLQILMSFLYMAGYEIRKGWHVNVDATCIHYDPAVYKDPMQFNPSRFEVRKLSSLLLPSLVYKEFDRVFKKIQKIELNR